MRSAPAMVMMAMPVSSHIDVYVDGVAVSMPGTYGAKSYSFNGTGMPAHFATLLLQER